MPNFGEYTNVSDVRSTYIKQTGTGDDVLMLDLIREVSRMMDSSAKTVYYPFIQTRNYDIPRFNVSPWSNLYAIPYDVFPYTAHVGGAYQSYLTFDLYLLDLLTLTNGEGTTIASSKYYLYPSNYYPKRGVRLKPTSGTVWLPATTGEWEQVIQVQGVWGYHEDYTNAWVDTAATLSAAITTTSATTFTCTTGKIKAGQLLKIDSEYFYASAVTTGASDTITVVRGANGSTAATHLISTAISYWQVDYSIQSLCRMATAAMYRLRDNPVGDTVVYEGRVFQTPKDIQKFIDDRIDALGASRVVFA